MRRQKTFVVRSLGQSCSDARSEWSEFSEAKNREEKRQRDSVERATSSIRILHSTFPYRGTFSRVFSLSREREQKTTLNRNISSFVVRLGGSQGAIASLARRAVNKHSVITLLFWITSAV